VFAIHFSLLRHAGTMASGAFMSPEFRASLIGA
jgi:hypothetical protein